MSRIIITGSSTGLGLMAGQLLAEQGHRVVLHARSDARAGETQRALPEAEAVVVGELPPSDDGPPVGAGVEETAREAARRVQRDQARVVVAEVPRVPGRVEQGHHAAGHVDGVGAGAVQPPPGARPEELSYQNPLSHGK